MRYFRILFIALSCFVSAGHSSLASSPVEEIASARINRLREEIATHDRLYFQEAKPVISDAEYDGLQIELQTLEAEWPELAVQPSRGIADERTGRFSTTQHGSPMLSLNKAYSLKEIREYYDRLVRETGIQELGISVEPKVDGMAVSLIYQDGQFIRALTRGNGREGEDITRNVQAIGGFPDKLVNVDAVLRDSPVPHFLEVRGEIYVSYADFHKLNLDRQASGLELFATPRSLAASTAMLNDPDEVEDRNLKLVFFDWGSWEPDASEPGSQSAFLQQLRDWDFPVVASSRPAGGIEVLIKAVEEAWEADHSIVPMDGLVLKLDAVQPRSLMGRSHRAPNWALAYKFPQTEVHVDLRGITFQVGRTGVLTPVAELNPTVINNRQVKRASLHNWRFIQENDIRIGDRLLVTLAGDVIPRITGRKEPDLIVRSLPYPFPAVCPACGGYIEFNPGMSSGFCRSSDCREQQVRQIVYFSRIIGIKGLGEETARKLVSEDLVHHPADLYRLAQLLDSGGEPTSEFDYQHLAREIRNSLDAPLWKIIQAMGIPGVGAVASRRFSSSFDGVQALHDWRPDLSYLKRVGLTSSVSESLMKFFTNPETLVEFKAVLAFFNS